MSVFCSIQSAALTSPHQHERQPAIGAEAPDMPAEPVTTRDAQVQADLTNVQQNVPAEFKYMSKQVSFTIVIALLF